MAQYKPVVNPYSGNLTIVRDDSVFHIKDSVDTYNDLPVTGNTENNVRITKDTDKMYTWGISASSGSLSDWKEIGNVASIDWSAIDNKPISSVADIDLTVSRVDQSVKVDDSPVFDGANFTGLNAPTKTQWKQNGFEDRSNSTISFTDATRAFSISSTGSNYKVFIFGVEYTISTSKSITISDTTGIHIIYFESDSSLHEIVNPTSAQIRDCITGAKALVSIIYWNKADGEAIYVGDERHGKGMSPNTHSYLHFTAGLVYLDGLGLNTMSVDGTGVTADAQFGIDAGGVADEDLHISISVIGSTDGFPIYYMSGSEWKRTISANFPMRTLDNTSSTRLAYNQYTGGAWQLSEVSESDFVLGHVFATTEKDNPLIVVMGQNIYTTKRQAGKGAKTEIQSLILDDLLFPEIRAVGTVIFQTNSSYANDINARIVTTDEGDNYIDFRNEYISRTAVTTTDHNTLTGLQGGVSDERYHLTEAEHTIVENTLGVNTGDETDEKLGATINDSDEKTTPVDADMVALMNSETSTIDMSLLLHGDVSPIVDSSARSHSIINTSVIASSVKKVFGVKSLLFNGASSLQCSKSSYWTPSASFTFDFHVNFSSLPSASNPFFNYYRDSFDDWGADYDGVNNKIRFWTNIGGGYNEALSDSWTPVLNTWYHIAIVRSSNQIYFFVDGISKGSPSFTSTIPAWDAWADFWAGRKYVASTSVTTYLDAYIDEFRYEPSIAEWTSNFTIPTSAYEAAHANILNKFSWTNIKATLKTYFDTLYSTAVKATGVEIDIGTDDAKFVTSKAIEDSGMSKGLGDENSMNIIPNGGFEQWSNGSSLAPDNWTLYASAGASVAREASITKVGKYSVKLIRTSADVILYNANLADVKGISYWPGRTVTFGCWAYATVANRASLSIWAGTAGLQGRSDYHTGDSTWQWLTVTVTLAGNTDSLQAQMEVKTGNTSCYFDGAILVEGKSSIAFSPKPVYLEDRFGIDNESNDTYVADMIGVQAYTIGLTYIFKVNTANTGTATLNINSIGAKTIVKGVNTTLADNDILASMFCLVVYDGTNFVLLNPRVL